MVEQKKMKALNDKEWKLLQNQVKEIDNAYNILGANLFIATLNIDMKESYSEILFNK